MKKNSVRKSRSRPSSARPSVEALEDRCLPSITIAPTNNNGQGYAGLGYSQSGGYTPPDTCGAAGPSSYVETVNQTVALFSPKATGAARLTDSFSHFWCTVGGLARTSAGSFLSDPVVAYDELIGRFVVGDQDVDGSALASNFDIAVSRTSNPATLTAADWNFYQVGTTEAGYDADYPGNFGYNRDAFVFTLNMFGTISGHTLVTSVSASDLASGVTRDKLRTYKNDLGGFSFRPTAMHGSAAGDPMWLVAEGGNGASLRVVKMTNVLSGAATFTTFNVPVRAYSGVVAPLNPNGSVVTDNIDSRILKAASSNNTLVATHAVSVSATQDVARWYALDIGSGAPVLTDQGDVGAGSNTYLYYTGIDINAAGAVGMSYMRSGTDSPADFVSMYVTGRAPGDAKGTMEAPVQVPSGRGVANLSAFGRAGDLSGISVDPSDGTFWAANEFATSDAGWNWGTAIANFRPTVADEPLAAIGTTLLAPKGATFSGVVASFSDADPVPGAPSAYAAVINWGDGSPTTAGTVAAGSGGGFNVTGTHTYTSLGQYQVTVTITDKDTSHDHAGSSATAVSTARVTGPYYLDDSGTLWQVNSSGGNILDRNVASFVVAGNGDPVVRENNDYVYEYRLQTQTWLTIADGAVTLAVAGNGDPVVLVDGARVVEERPGSSGAYDGKGVLIADGAVTLAVAGNGDPVVLVDGARVVEERPGPSGAYDGKGVLIADGAVTLAVAGNGDPVVLVDGARVVEERPGASGAYDGKGVLIADGAVTLAVAGNGDPVVLVDGARVVEERPGPSGAYDGKGVLIADGAVTLAVAGNGDPVVLVDGARVVEERPGASGAYDGKGVLIADGAVTLAVAGNGDPVVLVDGARVVEERPGPSGAYDGKGVLIADGAITLAVAGNGDPVVLVDGARVVEERPGPSGAYDGKGVLIADGAVTLAVAGNGDPVVLETDGGWYEFILASDGTYTGGRKRVG